MKTLGIIGGGTMAKSLLTGLLKQNTAPETLIISDTKQDCCELLAQTFNVRSTTNNIDLVQESEILLLAVKPQSIRTLCSEIAPYIRADQLIISIAAGVSTELLKGYFKGPLVRAMPNTPALIQEGITGLYAAPDLAPIFRLKTEQLLGSLGPLVWVLEEKHIDMITAISGSGPAYFFALAEALTQSAIDLGLTPDIAATLVSQTAIGAALLVKYTKESPTSLREQVSSKGGTTEQALKVLKAGDLQGLIGKAVIAAHQRAIELTKEL